MQVKNLFLSYNLLILNVAKLDLILQIAICKLFCEFVNLIYNYLIVKVHHKKKDCKSISCHWNGGADLKKAIILAPSGVLSFFRILVLYLCTEKYFASI